MAPAASKSKSYSNPVATQSDDAKYRTKYKELKGKVLETEEDNNKLSVKILKSKKAIQRLRNERAILYDRLHSTLAPTNPYSLSSAAHLSSLASSSGPSSALAELLLVSGNALPSSNESSMRWLLLRLSASPQNRRIRPFPFPRTLDRFILTRLPLASSVGTLLQTMTVFFRALGLTFPSPSALSSPSCTRTGRDACPAPLSPNVPQGRSLQKEAWLISRQSRRGWFPEREDCLPRSARSPQTIFRFPSHTLSACLQTLLSSYGCTESLSRALSRVPSLADAMSLPLTSSTDLTPATPAFFDTYTGAPIATTEFARYLLGSNVVGWSIQLLLTGVCFGWTAIYCRSDLWRRDTRGRKALLCFVVAVAAWQAGANAFLLFHWTTVQTRDAETIMAPSTINALQPVSVFLTGIPVQTWLAKRAIALLQTRWRRRVVTSFFGFLITLQGVFLLLNVSLNYLSHAGALHGTLKRIIDFNIASGTWLWSSVIIDVSITALLCVVLSRKIGAGFHTTDTLLRRLAFLSLQSASYTSLLAVTAATLAFAVPSDNLLYSSLPFGFWYNLPSCYVLSLLTAYSSRLIFGRSRRQANFADDGSTSSSDKPRPRGQPIIRLAQIGLKTDAPVPGPPSSCVCACRCGARPTPLPAMRMRERSRMRDGVESGLGSGIHVNESVVVVVEEDEDAEDEDFQVRSARYRPRPRLIPSSSGLSRKERDLGAEQADLEKGEEVFEEEGQSSDGTK